MKRSSFKPPSERPSRSSSPKGGSALSKRSSSPKGGSTLSKGSSSPKGGSASPYELQRKAAQRAALNALRRARRSAEQAGVSLSEWEDEFLTTVSERVKEHGRAFGDPELGGPGQALSAMQGRKLKEIAKKAKGETRRYGQAAKEISSSLDEDE